MKGKLFRCFISKFHFVHSIQFAYPPIEISISILVISFLLYPNYRENKSHDLPWKRARVNDTSLWSGESYKIKNKNLSDGRTRIRFRDNQARTDDFHHVKVILYRWVISLPYPPSGRRTDFLIITYQRVERLNTTIPPFFFHSNDVFPPENEQNPFLGNTYIQDPSIIIEQKRKDPMQPLTTSYK